jgi:peroxiredoxin
MVPARFGATAIAITVGTGILLALVFGEAPPDPLRPGVEAPPFALVADGDGKRVTLEDFRGRVVLLNFWATWCKACEDEMPAMEHLHRSLKDHGFSLVAVSVDEDREDVLAFRKTLDLTFAILLDPDRSVANAYQTYRFPESFLIDAEGRILARYIGPRDWDAPAYVDRIRRLLARGGQHPDAG